MCPRTRKELKLVVEEFLCKGCGYCVVDCPKKVLELSPTPNIAGIQVVKIVRPEDCIKCKKCELICPEMAIYLEPVLSNEESKIESNNSLNPNESSNESGEPEEACST